MIRKNNNDVTGIYYHTKWYENFPFLTLVITAVYEGARLVWEQIRSCYGKGKWFPEKPWLDNDTWKNE